jgi:hypothetical protein
MTTQQTPDLPRLVLQKNDLPLDKIFLDAQHLLIENPQAARGIIQAFIAEGRRFAQTEEGQLWQEILSHSELVKRGQMIWDAFGLDALVETKSNFMPQAWLDMLAAAVSSPDLETILSTLIIEELKNGNVGSVS